MKMSNLDTILKAMGNDKNIKTISLEFKRTTAGVRMTYEARIGDETKMGIEFVNSKDFEGKLAKLSEVKEQLLVPAVAACEATGDEIG